MNNGHHGALCDQIEADRIPQRELVLTTVWGAFFDASGVLGGLRPALSVSLYSLFIVVSFLLNGTPRVGTCPISPSLQLLVVVVRTEKYGRVRRMALNAIMAAFPLNTFVVLSCFSTLPAPWMIESVIVGGRSLLPSSSTMCRGGLSPWPRKGFSSL